MEPNTERTPAMYDNQTTDAAFDWRSPSLSVDELLALRFDNRFTERLPADPDPTNRRRQVPGACYSLVKPIPVKAPRLVAHAREVAELLDLSEQTCQSDAFVQVFTGNRLLPGMNPFAMRYGGHQFGNWAGQVGATGRAINLGEIVNQKDQRWMLQPKGRPVPPPYSRTADGLAVLRFVGSRVFVQRGHVSSGRAHPPGALSLTLTGEQVERDMFYDGHPKLETRRRGLSRGPPLSSGSAIFRSMPQAGRSTFLKQLADHTLATDFSSFGVNHRSRRMFAGLARCGRKTAEMIVHWMRVGFCAWGHEHRQHVHPRADHRLWPLWLAGELRPRLDAPTPPMPAAGATVSGHQPTVAHWNLAQLGSAILPLIGEAEPLQAAPEITTPTLYQSGWREMMAAKLGA